MQHCHINPFLPYLLQNRARGPNKRPPSKQKLREGGSSISGSSLSSSAQSPDPLGEPNLINRLESEIQSETGIFSTSPSKKVKVTLDDDLFGSIKVDTKPKTDSDDDLFATPASSKPKAKKTTGSLFATNPSSKPTPAAASAFDSPPEDIFAPSPGTRQAAVGADDIFASSTAVPPTKNLDDVLGSPTKKGKKQAKPEVQEDETDRKVRLFWTSLA
jgi:hypothetical protein